MRLLPKSRATLTPSMDLSVDPNIKFTCWPSMRLETVTQVNHLPFLQKEEVNDLFLSQVLETRVCLSSQMSERMMFIHHPSVEVVDTASLILC